VIERARDRHSTAVDPLEIMFIRQVVTEEELALIEEGGGGKSKNISIYLVLNIFLFRGNHLHGVGTDRTY
jgi:hypothetical protein